MGDARDPAERVVPIGVCGVHLAHDAVLGAFDVVECGHRGPHSGAAPVHPLRPQDFRWVRQPQFRCVGEQLGDVIEATVVDGGGVEVNQIGEGEPVSGWQRHGDSTAIGMGAIVVPRSPQRSRISGSSPIALETQMSIIPASRSGSVSSVSRCSTVPPHALVRHVPQKPCWQE